LTFKPLQDPIPHPDPLEMEYVPKDNFLKDLEAPIEKVRIQLNIFLATQPPLFEKKTHFLAF
jgi:hypothetical protein